MIPTRRSVGGFGAAALQDPRLHQVLFGGGSAANAAEVPPEHLFQDGRGDVRFEIDDSAAALNLDLQDNWPAGEVRSVGDILDHPELFEAYPGARDLPVGVLPALNDLSFGAFAEDPRAFDQYASFLRDPTQMGGSDGGAMILNPTPHLYDPEALARGEMVGRQDGDAELLKTVLHELQHYIDTQEGFDRGGMSRNYEQKPTEVVARMVEDRINLSPSERYADPHALGEEMRFQGQWTNERDARPTDPGWIGSLFGQTRPLTAEQLQEMMLREDQERRR